jgi:hypothetical protein
LLASPWLAPVSKDIGVRVFDVMHDILVRHHAPAPEARVIPLSAARARPAG